MTLADGVVYSRRQGLLNPPQSQFVSGEANPRCNTHKSRMAHLHPARVQRPRKPHVRNGTGAARNEALEFLLLRLHSDVHDEQDWATRKG